jgi:hypothetical protein
MVVEHAKYLEWIFRCKQVEMCTRHVEILDAGSMVCLAMVSKEELITMHINTEQNNVNRDDFCQSWYHGFASYLRD